ncbi:MAG: UDP-N-acetylglucosamine--LPS N-acetylglucosamine transferase [Myxococcota bacterium]
MSRGDAGRRRVLAVASGGGHWVQLRRIAPAFEAHDLRYVTVNESYRADVPDRTLYLVRDSTRWDKLGMLLLGLELLRIFVRVRPHVVVSTGAAPGCLAIFLGRVFGARTIWLDSIANVDEVSMSGRLVRRAAGLWLTQWSHLATEDGPEYAGRVF